jgi:hypothetical protein
MSQTVTAPGRNVVALDANQIITISPAANASGRVGRIGDLPGDGENASAYGTLTASTTKVVGPFINPTRHAIELSAGTATYAVSTPNPAYRTLLGRMDGFTGNRTLTADDNGKILRCDDASNVTITVPNSLAEGFNVGFAMFGAGTVTISAGSGATNRSSTSALSTQYQVGSLLVCRVARDAISRRCRPRRSPPCRHPGDPTRELHGC